MDTNDAVGGVVRTLRVIVLAMMAGVAAFSGVAYGVGRHARFDPHVAHLLWAVLAVLGLSELTAYQFLRRGILRKLRLHAGADTSDGQSVARALPVLQILTIVGCAMAEGFGLFGAMVVLITGRIAALAAPIITLILLAAQLPTRDKLTRLLSSAGGPTWS